jgi:hypothetical protein
MLMDAPVSTISSSGIEPFSLASTSNCFAVFCESSTAENPSAFRNAPSESGHAVATAACCG